MREGESDEETPRRVREIVKDPANLGEYVSFRLDGAVRNRPRHWTKTNGRCAGSSSGSVSSSLAGQ